MEIIIKNFQPHYNTALGKVITSERQYKDEIKRGGYIPYEQAQEIVKSNQERRSRFSVSDEAIDWMRDVRGKADKNGNVKLSDRQVEALNKRGMVRDRDNAALKDAVNDVDSRLPEHYRR